MLEPINKFVERSREGLKMVQMINRFVEFGRPFLKGSNLVGTGSITISDLELVRQLLNTLTPVTLTNYTLYDHLQLSAKFGLKISQVLNRNYPEVFGSLNPVEITARLLLHDFGRFLTHRWYRHELLEDLTLKKLGVRKGFIEFEVNTEIFIGKDPDSEQDLETTWKGMTVPQRVVLISDICGKRAADGGIKTFEEVIAYHQSTRRNYEQLTGQKALWACEKKLDVNVVDFSEKIFRRCFDWLLSLGIDLEEVRKQILEEEKNSEIKAVIFDVGGVLSPNPDPAILAAISNSFSMRIEEFLPVWLKLTPKMQIGEWDEEEFWKEFSQRLGRKFPENYKGLLTVGLVETGMYPEMRALIERIKQSGRVVAVHSDTVPVHVGFWDSVGLYNPFEGRIFSCEIGVVKKQAEAFKIAALRLYLPPQACLFVDDKEQYIENARSVGMKGIVFKNPSQLEEDFVNLEII